ncbi:hypothetical protein D3C71_1374850 [compost metagenome]
MRAVDITRHLIARFIEQVAARRARVAEEQSAALLKLLVGGKVRHRLLKQTFQFTHIVPQVGAAFDALPLLAAQQAVEGIGKTLVCIDARLWFGEIEALEHVGVGGNGHQGLVFAFHTLHDHQAAGLVQQADHAGENPLHPARMAGVLDQAAVDLDDVGFQIPDAVEVGVPSAEVIDGDQATQLAEMADEALELGLIADFAFDDFDHQTMRGNAGGLQQVMGKANVRLYADQVLRVQIEKQPGLTRGLLRKVTHMQGPTGAVQLQAFPAITRHGQQGCRDSAERSAWCARISPS